MAFHESHNKPEYIAGYAHQWLLGKPTELHAGAGYTVFLTSRTDILRYTPIPGILPIASVGYGKASLNTTFVPGTQGNGNIFFIWSKFDFN